MRPLSAMTAAFLIACAVPTASHAEGATGAGVVTQPPAAACDCPASPQRHAWRHHHHARHHAGHWRHWAPPPVALAPPAPYNPLLPAVWDSAYDRAMVRHFRSPAVSGVYRFELGYPPTPPIRGVQAYRVQAGSAVLQYDGLTGQYIPLAQNDALRVLAAAPVLR